LKRSIAAVRMGSELTPSGIITAAMSASGQTRRFRDVRGMSGLPQTADISGRGRHFAFVPKADILRTGTTVGPKMRHSMLDTCRPRRMAGFDTRRMRRLGIHLQIADLDRLVYRKR
jgi:hypothetical protein